jgi:hypothetical protein
MLIADLLNANRLLMTKKQSKLDPNRFKKEAQLDKLGMFSFDPIRRELFIKGLLVGASGSFFMLRPEFLWQMIGMGMVVMISNYHIQQGAQRISRWHAIVMTFTGLMLGMFAVLTIGNIAVAFYLARS